MQKALISIYIFIDATEISFLCAHVSVSPDLTLLRPCTIASCSHNTSSLHCFATVGLQLASPLKILTSLPGIPLSLYFYRHSEDSGKLNPNKR